MAGPGLTEWQSAFNITAATGLVVPLYKAGDYVYNAIEVVGTVGSNKDYKYNPYQVQANAKLYEFDDGGTPSYSKKDQATAAVGATVAGTNGNNPLSDSDYPYFYELVEVNTGSTTTLHESDMLTLVQIKTLIGTEVTADWTDPA